MRVTISSLQADVDRTQDRVNSLVEELGSTEGAAHRAAHVALRDAHDARLDARGRYASYLGLLQDGLRDPEDLRMPARTK